MPSRDDLQRQAHAIHNPFDDDIPRISVYTAQEIAILQSRLDKQLGPEYISTRKGPGGSNVHYLAADKVINLANEVFGFNGWSSSIRDTQIDYVDLDKDGKVSMGLSVIMRVTLKDGTYHEDVGYGTIANCTGKGAAFEKTKKEAATDAMKRALRNFGNVLGNCLYDKDYLKKIVKVKPPPNKWDAENLHRHGDFAPLPTPKPTVADAPAEKAASLPPTRAVSLQSRHSMASEYDDEFGGNAFDDVDFTRSDEFEVGETSGLDQDSGDKQVNHPKQEPNHMQARQVPQRTNSIPQARPPAQPPGQSNGQRSMPPTAQTRPPLPSGPNVRPMNAPAQPIQPQPNHMAPPNRITQPQQPSNASSAMNAQPAQRGTSSTPENLPQRPQAQGHSFQQNGASPQMPETPIGFVRGRAAEMIQGQTGQITQSIAFNPHAESPSIRKSGGINHQTSAPIRRDAIETPGQANRPLAQAHVPPQAVQRTSFNGPPQQFAPPGNGPAIARTNFVNPQQDQNRRIGAPMAPGMHSPGPRPGGYRPPGPAGMKRGPPDPINRPPLGDVSNTNKQAPGDVNMGEKRPRMQGQEDHTGAFAT